MSYIQGHIWIIILQNHRSVKTKWMNEWSWNVSEISLYHRFSQIKIGLIMKQSAGKDGSLWRKLLSKDNIPLYRKPTVKIILRRIKLYKKKQIKVRKMLICQQMLMLVLFNYIEFKAIVRYTALFLYKILFFKIYWFYFDYTKGTSIY